MTKTVKEWLESIKDEEVRAKALANMDGNNDNDEVHYLSTAIFKAFNWAETVEGATYWRDIFQDAHEREL